MKNKLIAASMVASISVLGSGIASAMEFDVYGSLRGGVYQGDTDSAYEGAGVAIDAVEATDVVEEVKVGDVADINEVGRGATKTKSRDALDLGHNSNFYTRIGIRGEEDLGNGMSAGFHFERGVGDTLTRRHENVWLKGGWGKLTLGQTDNTYRNVANWDQAWFLGGQARSSDGGSRVNGIRYDSNLGGPFSFSLQAIADDEATEDVEGTGVIETVTAANAGVTVSGGELDITVQHPKVSEEDGIDSFAASASFDAGVATINLGFVTNNVDSQNPGGSYDVSGISANGAIGALSWYVAYESAEDNTKLTATEDGACATGADADCAAARNYVSEVYTTPQDRDVIGVFLSYALGERDNLYIEYEDASVDGSDKYLGSLDLDSTLIGYSHTIGPGTTFITEFVSVDKASPVAADSTAFIAGFKVDF